MKMDRNYFKEKKTGSRTSRFTKCCNQDKDRHILNKKKPHEWELIEEYCENHLTHYSSTETIDPICCKICGRLIEYKSTVNDKAYKNRRKYE
jgi:hypothetical protein|tara:strand:+ start:316 stop:591 length:276 start_codon:yes stop_codon:yes gene_type:complete